MNEAMNHKWLQSEGNEKKLAVGNLKKFIARRRWQKTTNTIKAVSRLAGGLHLSATDNGASHGHDSGTFLDKVKIQKLKEEKEAERIASGGRKVFGKNKGEQTKPTPKLW